MMVALGDKMTYNITTCQGFSDLRGFTTGEPANLTIESIARKERLSFRPLTLAGSSIQDRRFLIRGE
jgi:hypothetical protein